MNSLGIVGGSNTDSGPKEESTIVNILLSCI